MYYIPMYYIAMYYIPMANYIPHYNMHMAIFIQFKWCLLTCIGCDRWVPKEDPGSVQMMYVNFTFLVTGKPWPSCEI